MRSLRTALTGLFTALIIVFSSLFSTSAHALERYSCVVQDFIGFGDDEDFNRKNKQKTFEIEIRRNEIVVASKSTHFKDRENTYKIVKRALFDVVATEPKSALGLSSVIIPANIPAALNKAGFFRANIALQSHFINNSWLLRCTP